MITIIYQFKPNVHVMWHCRIIFFRFLNNCKFGYTCFWLATIDIYIYIYIILRYIYIYIYKDKDKDKDKDTLFQVNITHS